VHGAETESDVDIRLAVRDADVGSGALEGFDHASFLARFNSMRCFGGPRRERRSIGA